MRPIAFVFLLALGVSAFATNAPDWLAGSYRLELSPDLKVAAQKLGVTEPYARIMLRPDGTFSYASNNAGNVSGTSGTYELSGHKLRLIANEIFPAQGVKTLSGKAEDGAIELDGLRYVKANANPSPSKTPANFDIVGTWNVHNGAQVDKSITMVFKDNRTFEFSGMAVSSKGRYELEGDKLVLNWTEVDGEAVEPGSLHKVIYLRSEGFFIDNYRYVRS